MHHRLRFRSQLHATLRLRAPRAAGVFRPAGVFRAVGVFRACGVFRPVGVFRACGVFSALALAFAVLAGARTARAAVVERVVALIDERPILLSDLKARAHPFLVRIHSEIPPGAQLNAAISQLYKEVLERIIDESLQQRAATKARLTVSAMEVEDAVARVASQNNVSPERVIAEAVKNGLTEEQYRQELRQQLLESKLINLRVQGRVRVTEQDLEAAYRRAQAEERQDLQFTGAWIRIHLAPRMSAKDLLSKRAFMMELAQKARLGKNFAELAQKYSEDLATRDQGGGLPQQLPRSLPASLRAEALKLEVGEVSAPVRVGDDLVILHIVERAPSKVPPFAEARAQLGQVVYLEKMNKARRHWLDSLRRRTHVEVRL